MAVKRRRWSEEKVYNCETFQQGLTQTKGISKGWWPFSQELPFLWCWVVCWTPASLRQERRNCLQEKRLWTRLCFWQEAGWENALAVSTCHFSRRWNDSEVGPECSDNGDESHGELFPALRLSQGPLSSAQMYFGISGDQRLLCACHSLSLSWESILPIDFRAGAAVCARTPHLLLNQP